MSLPAMFSIVKSTCHQAISADFNPKSIKRYSLICELGNVKSIFLLRLISNGLPQLSRGGSISFTPSARASMILFYYLTEAVCRSSFFRIHPYLSRSRETPFHYSTARNYFRNSFSCFYSRSRESWHQNIPLSHAFPY